MYEIVQIIPATLLTFYLPLNKHPASDIAFVKGEEEFPDTELY